MLSSAGTAVQALEQADTRGCSMETCCIGLTNHCTWLPAVVTGFLGAGKVGREERGKQQEGDRGWRCDVM